MTLDEAPLHRGFFTFSLLSKQGSDYSLLIDAITACVPTYECTTIGLNVLPMAKCTTATHIPYDFSAQSWA
jgi:hypothetical protein